MKPSSISLLPANISTRARITMIMVVLVVAALGLSSVGLYESYRIRQERAVEALAGADAAAVVALDRRGPLPTQLPALAPGPFTLVQVIDATGKVIAATPGLDGQRPIVDPGRLGRRTTGDATRLPFTNGAQRTEVLTIPVTLAAGPATVIVVVSTADNDRGEAALITGLVFGVPILALLAALLAWVATGRTLRPVEAMRRQAADITAGELHMRVPVPPGQDEVTRLATTINEMLGRLDQATDEQKRFVSDASHELRSPITGIRTALEVAIADEAPGPRQDHLRRLLAETERLGSLVDQLVVLASRDESHGPLGAIPVDLSRLLADEVGRATGPTVTADIEEGVTVSGDQDLLTRVIQNLLSNASRHATSEVRVQLSATIDHVRLTVTDDGPGIPVADRDRIFQRFVRLDDHRGRSTGGAGLGLAIARDAVTAHRGTIAVADTGPGASFVVVLPRQL